jgi:hypothetical protein
MFSLQSQAPWAAAVQVLGEQVGAAFWPVFLSCKSLLTPRKAAAPAAVTAVTVAIPPQAEP